jgi:hypothetical protein
LEKCDVQRCALLDLTLLRLHTLCTTPCLLPSHHDARRLALLDTRLEGWQVRVSEVLLRDDRVEVVARAAVRVVELIRLGSTESTGITDTW